ncbi:Uncharacterised protein [Starkeya nomas]|uniref:Uncharacterized protein n=1 Tax=Starkeya nomas TaxID=2666134 RepID=A0A5S9Q0Y1_9HYPH|nr:hypothetical protein [Starkeya nomas]CAA0110698.1 Uncharacterised protein [Starkeya nomas]
MLSFATEFPVKASLDRGVFIAELIAWLRGMESSSIFDALHNIDLDNDLAHLVGGNKEELRIRELMHDNILEAIGFRHDIQDDSGRLWRTEAVLKQKEYETSERVVRIRTQCIAKTPGAMLGIPKKPFFIKSIINDGYAGIDNVLQVTDNPIWLQESGSDLDLAKYIITGKASYNLPIIYISADNNNKWIFSKNQIIKLAFDLGGIAHVVVEPSKEFSFKIQEIIDDRNVYGGAIAISTPDRGVVRSFYLGWKFDSPNMIFDTVRSDVIAIRGQMPARGWDWTELQEQALRRQRERERNRLGASELESLYEEENNYLRDRIKQLEDDILSYAPRTLSSSNDDDLNFSKISEKVGPEIYPGEFGDRIRMAMKECIARSDQFGLDARSKVVFEAFISHSEPSVRLKELLDELEASAKDPKRMASVLSSLLVMHGYQNKSNNKHLRFEPRDGYSGLDNITIANTPSDYHSLQNLRKQIERTLGLSKLSK